MNRGGVLSAPPGISLTVLLLLQNKTRADGGKDSARTACDPGPTLGDGAGIWVSRQPSRLPTAEMKQLVVI